MANTTKFLKGQFVQSNYPHYGTRLWKECVITEVLPNSVCQSGTMYKATWVQNPSPNPWSSPLDEAWFRAQTA